MKLIGLTGGIACGKSFCSKYFEDKGIPVIDADLIARQIVQPGKPAWKQICENFGADVLLPDGNLNRPKLGSIVFSDPEKRKVLNSCTHPYIRREMLWQLFLLYLRGSGLVIFDAALLFESKWDRLVNAVVLVYCDEKLQLQRLMKRDNSQEEDAQKRINSQMPQSEKVKRAQFVVDNSGSQEETLRQLNLVLKKYTPSHVATVFWLLAPLVLVGSLAWGGWRLLW